MHAYLLQSTCVKVDGMKLSLILLQYMWIEINTYIFKQRPNGIFRTHEFYKNRFNFTNSLFGIGFLSLTCHLGDKSWQKVLLADLL